MKKKKNSFKNQTSMAHCRGDNPTGLIYFCVNHQDDFAVAEYNKSPLKDLWCAVFLLFFFSWEVGGLVKEEVK